jgi:hypothetical protein
LPELVEDRLHDVESRRFRGSIVDRSLEPGEGLIEVPESNLHRYHVESPARTVSRPVEQGLADP